MSVHPKVTTMHGEDKTYKTIMDVMALLRRDEVVSLGGSLPM